MRLVVDTNRIIAALIKDSSCRRILLSEKMEFITIGFGIREVEKYKGYILKKAKLDEEEFGLVMNKLFARMEIFEEGDISKKNYANAKRIMEKIDPKDVPFIALALETKNKGVWSDDKHFKKQKKIKTWSTKAVLKKI